MSKITYILASLAALAASSPIAYPQEIDLSAIIAAGPPPTITYAINPTTISINPSSLATEAAAAITESPLTLQATTSLPSSGAFINKRQAASSGCSSRQAQPTGAGPVPSPDTASAFAAYAYFSSVASAAPEPTGYTTAFTNLQSENNAYGYLGFNTLSSYDTQACAKQCNSIYGCQAINILFERDPGVDPGPGCDDPPSTTVIKCVFWGSPVTFANANNAGQWRDNFHVVVAGSNGYITNSNFPSVAGYTGPNAYGNRSINAPNDCNGQNTYMGYISWNDGAPFDPNRCAAACTAQSNYNLAHPPTDGSAPMLCNFINTYYLLKDGFTQAQVCAMYSETWNSSYATNTGYSYGDDVYTIASSVTYSNASNPGVCVATG